MRRDPAPPPDDHRGDGDDGDLQRLLAGAVDDLRPTDRLAAIQQRTRRAGPAPAPHAQPNRTKVTPMSDRRPWTYAAAGAAVAAAAVVVAVAVAGGTLTGDDDPAPAAGEPTPTVAEPAPEPSEAPTSEAPPAAEGVVVPAYYVGDGPRGPVLFREFHQAQVVGGDVALAAAQEVVGGEPQDPDYRAVWPAGTSVTGVSVDGGVARVDLAEAPARGDLTEREAELAVQGVVYSVQGALQERLPVQLTVGGQPVAEVLGVPTAEPLAQAPLLETLSLMSVTTPAEGEAVSGTFTAEGASNGFEATVQWQVLDGTGAVAAEGFTTAEGWMEERLFPWSAEVDVSGLEPGSYTFVARTDDPSGGEGGGPDEDTRTITVE